MKVITKSWCYFISFKMFVSLEMMSCENKFSKCTKQALGFDKDPCSSCSFTGQAHLLIGSNCDVELYSLPFVHLCMGSDAADMCSDLCWIADSR